MLFDLRGRGRRRTVQAIYLGLAVLMGGGLVLFGVGSGTSGGGLLNGIGNTGGGGAQTGLAGQAVKADLKAAAKSPSDPAVWSRLVQDRWTAAGQGTNFSATTGQFTAEGKRQLQGAVDAWQRYQGLVKTVNADTALLAARSYVALAQYPQAASAWEAEAAVNPTSKSYACLAITAYAAKQNPKGDLATAKAISLVPVVQRQTLKATITAAKTSPASAQTCLA